MYDLHSSPRLGRTGPAAARCSRETLRPRDRETLAERADRRDQRVGGRVGHAFDGCDGGSARVEFLPIDLVLALAVVTPGHDQPWTVPGEVRPDRRPGRAGDALRTGAQARDELRDRAYRQIDL